MARYWSRKDFLAGRCSLTDVSRLKPPEEIAREQAEKLRAGRSTGRALTRQDFKTEAEWVEATKHAEKALATRALHEAHGDALKPGGDPLAKATKLRRARKLVTEASASTATEAPVEQFTVIIEGMDGQPIDLSNRYDRQFYQTPDGEWGNRHLDELQARDPVVVDVVARLPAEMPTEATESTPEPLEPWKATNPFSDEAARRHGAALPADGFDASVAALRRAIQEIQDLL